MGLSYSEDRTIMRYDRNSSRFDTVPACDGQTDRQADLL